MIKGVTLYNLYKPVKVCKELVNKKMDFFIALKK